MKTVPSAAMRTQGMHKSGIAIAARLHQPRRHHRMPSPHWRGMDQATLSAMAVVSTRVGVSSAVDPVSNPTDSGSEDTVQRTTPNVAKAADNEHGCERRLSLLAIILPMNIVRLINSYLTTRCVWCDEGTGSLATVDGQYDWICIRCFTFQHDETRGGGRSVIDKVMRTECYRPGWRGPGGGNGSTDIQYRTVKRPRLG